MNTKKTSRDYLVQTAITLLLAVMTTTTVLAQNSFSGGSGNAGDPYIIAKTSDLQQLANNVNSGEIHYSGKFFKMSNNIKFEANDNNFTPIGTGDFNFGGTFDGNGYTISGIRFSNANGYVVGLFGQLGEGGTVKNVTLDNSQFTAKEYVGGIVGYNYCGLVTNCHVTSSVTINASTTNGKYFGGIVGINMGGDSNKGATVSYCSSAATLNTNINSSCQFYGAITGGNNSNCTLSHNLAIGATIPAISGHYGAITGDNVGTLYNNYYSNCTVAGTADATDVGCGAANSPSDIQTDDGAVHKANAFIISETESKKSWPEFNANDEIFFFREFTVGSASTICLPFAYTPDGSIRTFYTFTNVEEVEGKWEAIMTEVNGALAANTPYIFKATGTGTVMFHGPAAASKSNTSAGTTTSATSAPWTFKGTYNEIKWNEDNPPVGIYGFSAQAVADDGIYQGQFVKVGTYVKIRPLRAYLQYGSATTRSSLSEEELPDRIMVRLVGSGETSIGQLDLKTGEVTFDDGWYTLEGIRLNGKPTKQGIYVNKGKKYIIK